jgi:L-ascorbate metabolism protein UlaG (beta-lactamase superfamily)
MNSQLAAASVTYIGHSTTLIEMDGIRLLTDPLLRKFIGPLRRQCPLPDPELTNVDAVLISHLHGDHFDLASLKKLNESVHIILPKGAGPYLKLRKFGHVTEVEADETITIGEVKISATKAVHGGRNLPWTPIVKPLGFVIDGTFEIYFAGDTDLFDEMADIGQQLDLALLPVWGWGPNLGDGHMDPKRAAEALNILEPNMAIPIHWGTYCPIGLDIFRPRFLSEPPVNFAKHARSTAPDITVRILNPGQSMKLSEINPSE